MVRIKQCDMEPLPVPLEKIGKKFIFLKSLITTDANH